jgi:hypothetical protein
VLVGLAAGIGWMLLTLRRAEVGRDEQVAIGIGARMGNGLLTSLLAWLVLESVGASAAERLSSSSPSPGCSRRASPRSCDGPTSS